MEKTLTTQYQEQEKHSINICRLMFETQCTYPPTDPIDIINTAKKLKPKQSTGFDEISTKLMLHIFDEISLPFTHIVNTSFTTGIVPRQIKIAKVIPTHKSGDPTDFNNNRPISLLPAFSKLMEKLMYNRIIQFINSNSILYDHQYGFRKT